MNTYKITNVTNLVGKRDPKFNSIANIEYVDNRTKKVIALKAGQSVYLTVPSLPLSVHRLRIKNLIDVVEVSASELQKNMETSKPKPKPKSTKKIVTKKEPVETKKEPVETKEESDSDKKTSTTKKSSTSKKNTDD